MRLEAFFASFSPSFDPVAHRSLTDSQCSGDVFLLPTFLFQFPRSFPSFFSPIGFLWCSHASYCLILDFFLSRSVKSLPQEQEVIALPDQPILHLTLLSLKIQYYRYLTLLNNVPTVI